ncbi:MAG TPA: precorrin-6y C5,15-methyltransferase (decarboxylating) subunit CbiE [Desulfomonilaceae bacterium]|nr:precorrin-6y C5,15-methyltransferase (decarboxylating) subunit CbiE [Desulfomonilaceae bacterium]
MAVDEYAITIVGCGPGSPEYVTPAVLAAVNAADLLIGTERLLRLFPLDTAKRVVVNSSVEEALDEIEKQLDHGTVAVLVTGDPGVFSLAKLVIERFGRERCRVVPGISSVQTAFARLGLDWVDVRIVSAHKEDPKPDATLLTSDKIAVLLGREGSLRWVAELIRENAPSDRRIFLCENLTLDDELVREVQPEDLAKLDVSSRTVVLIVKSDLLV